MKVLVGSHVLGVINISHQTLYGVHERQHVAKMTVSQEVLRKMQKEHPSVFIPQAMLEDSFLTQKFVFYSQIFLQALMKA